jgi:hypothetical protein
MSQGMEKNAAGAFRDAVFRYSRTLAAKAMAVVPSHVIIVWEYLYHFGEVRVFLFPRSFNELIQHRKLFNRNPLLPLTTDKYAARAYVAEKIGEQYLVPLYGVADDPEAIDFAALPVPFVAKATHGCGFNIFVRGRDELERDKIVAALRRFLAIDWSTYNQQWAYRGIPRRVIVEKMLSVRGESPADYKFFAFHGRVRLIQYDIGRHSGHMTKNSFDEAWRPLAVEYFSPRAVEPIEKPACLAEMIRISEKLAADFDFVRVDLYLVEGCIYFSELTHYPNAGLSGFTPRDFDRALGDVWRLGTPIPQKYYLDGSARPICPAQALRPAT